VSRQAGNVELRSALTRFAGTRVLRTDTLGPLLVRNRQYAVRSVQFAPRAAALLAPALLAASSPLPAWGQRVVELTRNAGEIGVDYQGVARGYGDGRPSTNMEYRQWVQIPIAGSVLAPHVLSYRLVVRPLFTQTTATGLERPLSSRHLGSDFNMSLLEAKPLSFHTSISRNAGRTRGGFGGESDFAVSSLFAQTQLRSVYVPLRLSYGQRDVRDHWRASLDASPILRDERHTTTQLTWQSSKTALRLEHLTLEDRVGALDFTARRGNFSHQLRWGKGSTAESLVEYEDRVGDAAQRRTLWTERLQLRHTSAVSTNYFLSRSASEFGGRVSRAQSFGGGFSFRVSRWLSTSASAGQHASESPAGRSDSYVIAPRFDVTFTPVRRVQVSAGFAGGYERQALDIPVNALIDVLDERHVVDLRRTVTLKNPRADPASLIVRSADQTITYTVGIDYRVVETGPLLQIQILPGSRIAVDDVLVLSYQYAPLPGRRRQILDRAFNARVSIAGLSLHHARSVRDAQALVAVEGELPPDSRSEVTELRLSHPTWLGTLDFSARHRHQQEVFGDYLDQELRLSLAPPRVKKVETSVGLVASDGATDNRHLRVLSASTTIALSVTSALRLHANADAWLWRLDDEPDQRYLNGLVAIDWRIGQIETRWRYEHQRRRAALAGDQTRISGYVVRRF
jgi:hypothetical protein